MSSKSFHQVRRSVCLLCARSARATVRPRRRVDRMSTKMFGSNARSRQNPPSYDYNQYPSTSPSWTQARDYYKFRNRTLVNYALSFIFGTVALSYGSVPMYKMICQKFGWGGQPVKAEFIADPDADHSKRLTPVADAQRIRITFKGATSDMLPWKFTPQQREVRVLPGETALAFYTATNNSDEDIIGVATYSVVPGQAAPYFSKIQCFCFEEQRLLAGESVDMPVFFYIDPEAINDLNMRGVATITLSYTFFKAKYDKAGHLEPVRG